MTMRMTILYEQCQWSTKVCNFQFYFCDGMVGDRSKRKTCFWLSIYITLQLSEFRFSIVAVKERRIVKITWYWTAVGIQLWNSNIFCCGCCAIEMKILSCLCFAFVGHSKFINNNNNSNNCQVCIPFGYLTAKHSPHCTRSAKMYS